jgi:hypothetical protein
MKCIPADRVTSLGNPAQSMIFVLNHARVISAHGSLMIGSPFRNGFDLIYQESSVIGDHGVEDPISKSERWVNKSIQKFYHGSMSLEPVEISV